MKEEIIRIAILEDHNLVRESLANLLNAELDFEVVYHVGSETDLKSQLKSKLVPDVFLVDYNLKKGFGDSSVKLIRKELGDEVKILGLSFHKEERIVQRMLKAGSNGFIFKDYGIDEFKEAIISVYKTGYHINPYVTQILMEGVTQKDKREGREPLTETEMNILLLICEQHTNEEIADILNLSKHTIHTYRNRLLTKTDSSNTAGLVVFAIKNGIFHLPWE